VSATRTVKSTPPTMAGARATLAFRAKLVPQKEHGRCSAFCDRGVCNKLTLWAFELPVPTGSFAALRMPGSKFYLHACRKHGKLAERTGRLDCFLVDPSLVDAAPAAVAP